MKPAKFSRDTIAQELDRSEAVGEDDSVMIAMIKMFPKEGRIGLMWTPMLFNVFPMPDELRAKLVEMLRYHAARLEDRSLDERMKNLDPTPGGSA